MIKIPFNRPTSASRFLDLSSDQWSGDGPYTEACHELLGSALGCRALLTTSCTHALEMAAHLLELGPGDEVIVPSFTFVSTANAFVLRVEGDNHEPRRYRGQTRRYCPGS